MQRLRILSERLAGVRPVFLPMLLISCFRPWGLASPTAAAWLCAAMDGSPAAYGLWLGLSAGSLIRFGWMPAAVLAPAASLAWMLMFPRGCAVWMRIVLSGLLALLESAAASGMNGARAAEWLACALAAVLLTMPLSALYPAEPERGKRWAALRKRLFPSRGVSVALAETIPLTDCTRIGQQPEVKTAEVKSAAARREARSARLGLWILHLSAVAGAAGQWGAFGGLLAAGLSAATWQEMLLPLSMANGLILLTAGIAPSVAGAACALGICICLTQSMEPLPAAGIGLSGAAAWILCSGGDLRCIPALLPAAAWYALRGVSGADRQIEEAQQIRAERRNLARKLGSLANVLSEMGQGFGTGPDPPGEQALLTSLRAKLCTGCGRYETCWNGRAGEGKRLLCDLMTEAVGGRLPEADTPWLRRRCIRSEGIPKRLYAELRQFALQRNTAAAQLDGARMARYSIETAAETVRAMAEALRARESEVMQVRLAEDRLRVRGLCARIISQDRMFWLRFAERSGLGTDIALRASNALFGKDWCGSVCGNGTTLRYTARPALLPEIGWDTAAREADNGDQLRTVQLEPGRWLILLCDGMGVGAQAARHSHRAADLTERFLRSGLQPERAVRLANQSMYMTARAEGFSTLDACVVDGVGRTLTFLKMAGCDSYFLRDGRLRTLSGGCLPMGILPEARPMMGKMTLKEGDILILGTDGVMDGLTGRMAADQLGTGAERDVQRLAERLRSAGDARRTHEDDQTLAVIRFVSADAAAKEA